MMFSIRACGLTLRSRLCLMCPGMDREELYITAHLARLELSEEEIDRFQAAVLQLLKYFDKMMEMDVENLKPTTQLIENNRLREDVLSDYDMTDQLLQSAPELEERFVVIPNVL